MKDQIQFYGSENRELFAIERASMDRCGKVVEFLNNNLPVGMVLDIGAGDGHTASQIINSEIICLEPAPGIVNFSNNRLWAKGTAENIPFHNNYFDAAYATWAYFLPGVEKTKGLKEVERVVKPGGKIIIIDNAGGDEFTSYAESRITESISFYTENGFSLSYINTAFEFTSKDDALSLMTFFFGNKFNKTSIKLTYSFRVAAYMKTCTSGMGAYSPTQRE